MQPFERSGQKLTCRSAAVAARADLPTPQEPRASLPPIRAAKSCTPA